MINFKFGTNLAVQQDNYIQIYTNGGSLTQKQISDMEQNLWVSTASKLAPNNLVVRQWCLIDLFKGIPTNAARITNLMDVLTYRNPGEYRIHAEGYSYYNYIRNILDLWMSKFQDLVDLESIKQIINKTNQGFIMTSYYRQGCWYPAPFGDLRDEPLSNELQLRHPFSEKITVSNITLNNNGNRIWYDIVGKPIGLNTHIPVNNSTVDIVNEIPSPFKFYEGYDKKYKNAWEEYKDTYNIKRLRSII